MRSAVTFSLAALLALPAASCAQEHRTTPVRKASRKPAIEQQRSVGEEHAVPDPHKASRRLETVTWNSVKHELTWIISNGQKVKDGASFQSSDSENYLINMDDATMTFKTEKRRFSKEEAANVHVLMDLIAKYAVDSTVWWDDGQGEPVTNDDNGTKEPQKPRKHQREKDDENTPVLHVADRGVNPAISAHVLDLKIQQLEGQLAALKELQKKAARRAGKIQLTSYSRDIY